jgi:predicted 3-demethylubiquinone-9 3-methyltransferase (glyoxalase superfamily)
MPSHAKIMPCLWFDSDAEQAVAHYLELFPRSRVLQVAQYPADHPTRAGRVMTIWFELGGVQFQALNGGADFPFTQAISLSVSCANQDEIDRLWERLSDGGRPNPCGWVRDRFGLFWQVVPEVLAGLLDAQAPAQAARVINALLGMEKIEIEALERAAAEPRTVHAGA